MRPMAEKRHNDWRKAIRRRRIAKEVYGPDEQSYDNLHQYSDNKIQCSRPKPSAKTRTRRHGFAPAHNPPITDRRAEESMNEQELDFYGVMADTP